jgi:Phage integrase family.
MKGQGESSSSIGLQVHASHYDHQGRKQSVLSAHRLIDHCVLANHLEVGTTKSGEGRSFYVTTELRKILKAQLDSIEALKKRGIVCPYVFHRVDGSQIRDFKKLWRKACEAAGYPGKLFHDFRRTAVRNLERAGVPRSTAMAMVGHKTESIYRRYAIVDEAMHREASAKLDVWASEEKAKAAAERRGQIKRFKSR